jgi:plastocyanin
MHSPSDSLTRRNFLRGTAAAAATAAVASSSASAQEGQTHTVDMTDELVFDPESLTIAPGDTVVWENVGSVGHSVTAYEEDIPAEAEYFASGGFDNESAARSNYPGQGDIAGGESYEYTFETTGTYEYFCIPHESVGMVGTITVQEGGAQEPAAAELPSVPDSAKTLAVAATTALVSVVSLIYFFMKYGGDYGSDPGDRPGGRET